MSDPMNRPIPPDPDRTRGNVPPPVEPPPGEPRKGTNPLLWILVLIALLALGWYFLSQRDGVGDLPTEPTTPVGEADVDATDPGADAAAPGRDTRPASQPARPATVADRDATVLAQVEPTYPIAAARAREEGTVLVRADIDASGKPTNVEVTRRSGSRELDRAAVDAVRQWTFEPAMQGGKAVASSVQVPVDFKLDTQ